MKRDLPFNMKTFDNTLKANNFAVYKAQCLFFDFLYYFFLIPAFNLLYAMNKI